MAVAPLVSSPFTPGGAWQTHWRARRWGSEPFWSTIDALIDLLDRDSELYFGQVDGRGDVVVQTERLIAGTTEGMGSPGSCE